MLPKVVKQNGTREYIRCRRSTVLLYIDTYIYVYHKFAFAFSIPKECLARQCVILVMCSMSTLMVSELVQQI